MIGRSLRRQPRVRNARVRYKWTIFLPGKIFLFYFCQTTVWSLARWMINCLTLLIRFLHAMQHYNSVSYLQLIKRTVPFDSCSSGTWLMTRPARYGDVRVNHRSDLGHKEPSGRSDRQTRAQKGASFVRGWGWIIAHYYVKGPASQLFTLRLSNEEQNAKFSFFAVRVLA